MSRPPGRSGREAMSVNRVKYARVPVAIGLLILPDPPGAASRRLCYRSARAVYRGQGTCRERRAIGRRRPTRSPWWDRAFYDWPWRSRRGSQPRRPRYPLTARLPRLLVLARSLFFCWRSFPRSRPTRDVLRFRPTEPNGPKDSVPSSWPRYLFISLRLSTPGWPQTSSMETRTLRRHRASVHLFLGVGSAVRLDGFVAW